MSALDDPVWYISRDNQRVGPFSAEQFARFETAGTLRPTDQVWQTGMPAWIAYSDYDASRNAEAALEGPDRPSPPTKADDRKCAICLFVRRGMRALTRTFITARYSVSKMRGVSTSSPAAGPSPVDAPVGAARRTARPTAQPRPASIHPSLVRAQEPLDLRPLDNRAVQQPAIGVMEDHTAQEDRSMPDVGSEGLTQSTPQLSSPTPRLASEVQAAVQIGLDLETFRAWVAAGRLPHALPDCGKYDMKAIHLALDRMSGIAPRVNGLNELVRGVTRHKS